MVLMSFTCMKSMTYWGVEVLLWRHCPHDLFFLLIVMSPCLSSRQDLEFPSEKWNITRMTVCVKLHVWLQDSVSQSYGVHLVGVSHSLSLPRTMKQTQANLLTLTWKATTRALEGMRIHWLTVRKKLNSPVQETELSNAHFSTVNP